MPDWQYGQTIDAIQNVFVMSEVASAPHFDWTYWKASAHTLPVSHPTIARATPSATPRGRSEQRTMDKTALPRIRHTHASVLDQLKVEIRRRSYSIRTEQAYESWVARYLAFVDHADPCGREEVVVRDGKRQT